VRIEFGSVGVWNSFMLAFDVFPIAPLFPLVLLATYQYIPHLVLCPIASLKSPSNLDMHVIWFGYWF